MDRKMGRRKLKEFHGMKTGLVYTDPYLNLVRGILEQVMRDLVIDSNCGSLKKARNEAFSFFFDESSHFYCGFRQWCELAGFRESYWQQKALMKIALKVIKHPVFCRKITLFLQNSKYGSMLKFFINTLRRNYRDNLALSKND